ncbi:PE family protein [Mycobacterium paragordonae]|uniref:PE family protein n=1 Tax=Mycobacterium paragordonae TaxID=1389713 RepID=UPI001E28563A|nr:PE-PPE domain-containing protein [Mycobacterium paragordonae]
MTEVDMFVLSAPETLATAAADLTGIREAIDGASAAAAAPISRVLAAAEDEVSLAIADVMSLYGNQFQAVAEQATAFQARFDAALAAAARWYADAEAANASLLTGFAQTASVDPLTALIMGGNDNPQPIPEYVAAINEAYIQPRFPGAVPQGLYTPEQFWPNNGTLTFGQSVAQGVTLLNDEINHQINTLGNSVVVFGYSQSAAIATNEINALMAMGAPHAGQLSFVLASNPNAPDGGILARFPGFYIPFLDVPFTGATPPNSPYPTSMYTIQYDGVANAPQYPLHVLSDLNALMGYFYLHPTYQYLTAAEVGSALLLPTAPGYTGNTQYYMWLTQNLPLLQPIRDIPLLGPPLADLIQPDLRVLVDLGYGNIGIGADYPNVPTPARLWQVIDPFTVTFDLAKGAVQGPQAALVDIGLLPPAYLPDTYPYVPSLNPGLSLSFGQPSVTGLSVLSCALGSVLHLIPPANTCPVLAPVLG